MTQFIAEDYEVLEPGIYPATFDRTEESEEPGKFGPYIDWFFDVPTPDGSVEVMGRSSLPDRLTRSTKARGWLEGILGRPLVKGESTNTAKMKGTPVVLTIDIVKTEKGDERNRIVNVSPARSQAPAAKKDKGSTAIDHEYPAFLAAKEAEKAAIAAADAEEPSAPLEPAGDLPDDDLAA